MAMVSRSMIARTEQLLTNVYPSLTSCLIEKRKMYAIKKHKDR
ncbi:hypothetical protein QWZ16_22830 [Vibrio ostreicida]|uniref:Uncharacterized protein n=1 Tax=Vibrio ostreicida TaxID=526588 RepID=A0ABT8BZK3_9VIBR|nr:hypothetical protein [Vibrio ostreicida]MDN3612438.1 hypothetical protein [Vibrio ostreicida]